MCSTLRWTHTEDTIAHPQFPVRQEPTAPLFVLGDRQAPWEGRSQPATSALPTCLITRGTGKELLIWIENQARLANPKQLSQMAGPQL